MLQLCPGLAENVNKCHKPRSNIFLFFFLFLHWFRGLGGSTGNGTGDDSGMVQSLAWERWGKGKAALVVGGTWMGILGRDGCIHYSVSKRLSFDGYICKYFDFDKISGWGGSEGSDRGQTSGGQEGRMQQWNLTPQQIPQSFFPTS